MLCLNSKFAAALRGTDQHGFEGKLRSGER